MPPSNIKEVDVSKSVPTFEQIAHELLFSNIDIERGLQIISGVRERIVVSSPNDYKPLLQHLFPAFKKIITNVSPSFYPDTVNHKVITN